MIRSRQCRVRPGVNHARLTQRVRQENISKNHEMLSDSLQLMASAQYIGCMQFPAASNHTAARSAKLLRPNIADRLQCLYMTRQKVTKHSRPALSARCTQKKLTCWSDERWDPPRNGASLPAWPHTAMRLGRVSRHVDGIVAAMHGMARGAVAGRLPVHCNDMQQLRLCSQYKQLKTIGRQGNAFIYCSVYRPAIVVIFAMLQGSIY